MKSIALSPSSLTLAGRPAYPHRAKERVSCLVLLSFELLVCQPRAADRGLPLALSRTETNLCGAYFVKFLSFLAIAFLTVHLERGLSHFFLVGSFHPSFEV